jgi:hypothetical protein
MKDEFELKIRPDGVIESVYQDGLGETLGAEVAKVCRASNVEWEEIEDRKGWAVRAAHDPQLAARVVNTHHGRVLEVGRQGDIMLFASREEALDWEVSHFWDLLPKRSGPVKTFQTTTVLSIMTGYLLTSTADGGHSGAFGRLHELLEHLFGTLITDLGVGAMTPAAIVEMIRQIGDEKIKKLEELPPINEKNMWEWARQAIEILGPWVDLEGNKTPVPIEVIREKLINYKLDKEVKNG